MLNWCYILFTIWLLLSILFRRRSIFFDSRFMLEVGFLMYYAIPGMRHVNPELWGYENRFKLFYGHDSDPTFKAFFCILLYYASFLLLHHFKFKTNLSKSYGLSEYKLYIPNETRTAFQTADIVAISSLLLFVIYCSFFGGIREVLMNIASIRGGAVVASESKYVFLNKLFRCAPFAVYLTIDYRRIKEKKRYYFYFFTAALIVVSYGGRGILLQFFMILFIGDYIYRKTTSHKKYLVLKIAILALIAFFAIMLYRPLLYSMVGFGQKGINEVWASFITEITTSDKYGVSTLSGTFSKMMQSFDHYSISLETAILAVDSGQHHCRHFMKLFTDLFSIIPSQLLGISKGYTITYYNSLYISGAPKMVQIPAGIVGEAYYTGGIIWVILYGTVMGAIGSKIERLYNDMKGSITFAPTYYFALLFMYFGFAVGGDFASLFQKSFTSLIVIFYINHKMKVNCLDEQ